MGLRDGRKGGTQMTDKARQLTSPRERLEAVLESLNVARISLKIAELHDIEDTDRFTKAVYALEDLAIELHANLRSKMQ